MKTIEKLTYSTVMFQSKHSDGNTSTGTGFFIYMCHNKTLGEARVILVTNKHVVKNAVETKITFCIQDENGNPNDQIKFSEVMHNVKWIMHPNHSVDLCCHDMTSFLQGIQFISHVSQTSGSIKKTPMVYFNALSMDTIPSEEELKTWDAMEELIMIGYPNGIYDEYNNKPVIRKGISATHIKNDYNGQSEFLIDMACFQGSSGSPVFAMIEKMDVENNVIKWGKQVFFVGVLHAGPQHFVIGEIYQNGNIKTISRIPNNLGCVVKARELKVLENMLYKQNPDLKE